SAPAGLFAVRGPAGRRARHRLGGRARAGRLRRAQPVRVRPRPRRLRVTGDLVHLFPYVLEQMHRLPEGRSSGEVDARVLPLTGLDRAGVPLPGQVDLGLRLLAPHPRRAVDALTGLELLVDLEEVLDLGEVELGQVVDVAQVRLARVVGRHAEDL